MITRRIKKSILLGANPLDFYDLTIESEKIISESDISQILSKRYSFEKYSGNFKSKIIRFFCMKRS